MPWGGGCVADIGGNCNRGRVISAEATRDRWLQINGLDGAGHTTPSRTVLSPPNPVTGIQNRDIEFAEIVWAFFKARLP